MNISVMLREMRNIALESKITEKQISEIPIPKV